MSTQSATVPLTQAELVDRLAPSLDGSRERVLGGGMARRDLRYDVVDFHNVAGLEWFLDFASSSLDGTEEVVGYVKTIVRLTGHPYLNDIYSLMQEADDLSAINEYRIKIRQFVAKWIGKLSQIQENLRGHLDRIIAYANQTHEDAPYKLLISVKVEKRFSIGFLGKCEFLEVAFPHLDGEGCEPSVEDLIKALDSAFVEMISALHLRPTGFQKCARAKCGTYFYQFTDKKKIYCSHRCGAADSQARKRQKLLDASPA